MPRDRDSPVEWTGNAHLVTVGCPLCDESHSVAETTAEHYDGDVVCPDCSERMDDLHTDMYIRDQTSRLRLLGDLLRHRGFHTKAAMLEGLATEMEKYEPVIQAVENCRSGDFSFDREGIDRAIQKYE